ncbi:probable serine/threonine-protein kinase DDB_G0281745 at C-terminar half [Coccomyxa sp. Obi]|nr:probable serine/threonine-protein kinase DDB_G0281745 at C-terminar half [Coccomyxa sp. Obi]
MRRGLDQAIRFGLFLGIIGASLLSTIEGASCATSSTVRSGDTLWGIARAHNDSLADVEAANPDITDPDVIQPGQTICLPRFQNCTATYTVKSGDTVYSIASAHGTTIPALEAANPNIATPNEIFPGQNICLPYTSTPSGGHSNVGLIVGVVVGVCAAIAVVLLGAFLLLRRRERLRMQQHGQFLESPRQGNHRGHVGAQGVLHDSDNIIPPSNGGPPRSYVPYLSIARAGRMQREGGQQTGNQGNGFNGDQMWQGNQAVGSPTAQLGSPKAPKSESLEENNGAPERMSLPQIVPLRDWELDLDKLQVEVNDKGEEVVLGRGGFGVVVKGTYRLAPVAIKRLRNQSPEQQEAFLREMAILRACRGSRYIVPFVGASLLPGDTILAMDFMEGGNLWDALTTLDKKGDPIYQWNGRGKRVAHDIALGMHFLHDRRVVHLDLKSCNVLLAADGTAKISDVGLAALMSHNYLSKTAPAGTWAWVAPEVLMAGKVTHKADIFSFGVVLWEIITAERPTWRGNGREIRVPEEAPQEIADLVFQCTASEADARPQAHECAQIIARFLHDGG